MKLDFIHKMMEKKQLTMNMYTKKIYKND